MVDLSDLSTADLIKRLRNDGSLLGEALARLLDEQTDALGERMPYAIKSILSHRDGTSAQIETLVYARNAEHAKTLVTRKLAAAHPTAIISFPSRTASL